MQLKIDNFHGIQPRVHPSLLADGMAVRAHNCRLKNGKLVPLRQPSPVTGIRTHLEAGLGSITEAKSLYAWKHTANGVVLIDFLAFPGIVDFAEGNVADDEYDRLFVSGKTGVPFIDSEGKEWPDSPAVYLFRRDSNAISSKSICKAPLAAPSVSSSDTLDTSKTVYYEYFFAAWTDFDGYESGLSPASVATGGNAESVNGTSVLKLNSGMAVTFAAMDIPAEAKKVYIYASAAGSDESADGIQFFRKISAQTARGGVSLRFVPENLGEREPGIESPPGDLSCIKFVSGGFYCGFSKSSPHTVMFSDIGIVTSWPVAYRYDVKDNIVALATTSNSVFALTDGWPWVLTGTAPESMTVAKLAGPAACVSPRGVCVYRNSVYYVSNEGLMAIANDANAGTVCVNITQKAFTEEQWRALHPETCLLSQRGGALFLFFDGAKDADGNRIGGLTIDLNETADAIATHDETAACFCTDDRTATSYFVRKTGSEVSA